MVVYIIQYQHFTLYSLGKRHICAKDVTFIFCQRKQTSLEFEPFTPPVLETMPKVDSQPKEPTEASSGHVQKSVQDHHSDFTYQTRSGHEVHPPQ